MEITAYTAAEIILVMRVESASARLIHKNRPSHGLVYFPDCEMDYLFADGQVLEAKPGRLLYLPEGSDYRVVLRRPGDCWAINFLLTEKKVLPPQLMTLRDPAACYSLLRGAEHAWRTRGPGWRCRCMSALYGLLGQAEAEAAYLPSGEREALRQAETTIREQFTQPLSVEALAASCGVSSVAFRRRFARVYGMPPLQYIRNLRLELAEALLSSGECTAAEAALRSGFGDPSYFSREYKKIRGVTPGSLKPRHS